jgi:hypothetical protein
MTFEAWVRLLLLFGHLILCVFALHLLVKTDLRVLRRRVSAGTLMRVHRRMVWLLVGLWASGAAMLAVDYFGDPSRTLLNAKLIAKLVCVLALTANAFVLRFWALPRLGSRRAFGALELRALAVVGAISSASWLMAAFIGIARPMATWSPAQAVGLYALVLGSAIVVALVVCPGRLQRRDQRSGLTAVEEAAETLTTRVPARTGTRSA